MTNARFVPPALLLAFALVLVVTSPNEAQLLPRPLKLVRTNRQIQGRVVDYTRNHGSDNRMFSPALGASRDLYVYLPPGYNPCRRYPLAVFLHGFFGDEQSFLEHVVPEIDRAVVTGRLPPLVMAAPDGRTPGACKPFQEGSFFVNSRLGRYEDYLVKDVYAFVTRKYPVHPDPRSHVMIGASLGGAQAFSVPMKYPDRFRIAVGISPPLNTRWMSCRGNYRDDFDPSCWGWREDFGNGREVVARFYGIPIRVGRMVEHLYGLDNPHLISLVAGNNPIELLDALDIKPGDLEMYVGYGGRDEFNLDAQIESFIYRARMKGLDLGVGYLPEGRHNPSDGKKLLPGIFAWLRPRLEPFAPR